MSGPFTFPVAEATPFEPGRNPDSTGQQSQLTKENVQDAIEEAYWTAPGLIARFTLTCLHNGTISDDTFFGYSDLISGDATPIIIPKKSTFLEFTFSNQRSNADYTLEFRKNSTTATPFLTVSKTNTQFFFEDGISEPFNAGDAIFIKYVDNGTNARDCALVMYFRNEV